MGRIPARRKLDLSETLLLPLITLRTMDLRGLRRFNLALAESLTAGAQDVQELTLGYRAKKPSLPLAWTTDFGISIAGSVADVEASL